ncbi:MAG TPA: sensor domain-containing phosphodiesterase, partial [Clostridiales bacterium]|nr:sensor domain-containing phosphodiesterase [Clostridiales bacterium]
MGKSIIKEKGAISTERKSLGVSAILIFSALLVVGALYIAGAWDAVIREQSRKAVELAEAAEAGLPEVDSVLIEGIGQGTIPAGYELLKDKLAYLVRLGNAIRFAYIMYMHQGSIYFAVDSEPEDSPDYSPPGQLYYEADPITYNAFTDGKTVVTEPSRDRWGLWVSVLVPMKDLQSGETIAVFGVDFPAESWADGAISRAVEAGLMVASVLLVVAVLHVIAFRNNELRRERNKLLSSEKRLKESETMFRTIFEQVRMGVALVHNDRFMSSAFGEFPTVNPRFLEILGQKMEDMAGLRWDTITHPEDLAADLAQFARFKAGAIPGYSLEKRFLRPDGTWVWVNMTISPLYLGTGTDAIHLCVIEDIRHRKAMEQTLRDSERSKTVLLDNLPGMAYR